MLYYPLSFKGQGIYRISYCSPYLFYICLFAFPDEMTVSLGKGEEWTFYTVTSARSLVGSPIASAQLTSEMKTGWVDDTMDGKFLGLLAGKLVISSTELAAGLLGLMVRLLFFNAFTEEVPCWLEKWADRNFVKFNTGSYKFLHLYKNNSMHQYRLGQSWEESSLQKRTYRSLGTVS